MAFWCCCSGGGRTELCVNNAACSGGSGLNNGAYSVNFTFTADGSSSLVPGTSLRSKYTLTVTSINTSGHVISIVTYTLMTLTYNSTTQRWEGFTTSPPGEAGYAYRWHVEIQSNIAQTVDPGLAGCKKRHFVTDTSNNVKTPDFGIYDGSSSVTETQCCNKAGCVVSGSFQSYLAYVPKFLVNIPSKMSLHIATLSDANDGDVSGTYVIDNLNTYVTTISSLIDASCTADACGNKAGLKVAAGCSVNCMGEFVHLYFSPSLFCCTGNARKVVEWAGSQIFDVVLLRVSTDGFTTPTTCVHIETITFTLSGTFDPWGGTNTYNKGAVNTWVSSWLTVAASLTWTFSAF